MVVATISSNKRCFPLSFGIFFCNFFDYYFIFIYFTFRQRSMLASHAHTHPSKAAARGYTIPPFSACPEYLLLDFLFFIFSKILLRFEKINYHMFANNGFTVVGICGLSGTY